MDILACQPGPLHGKVLELAAALKDLRQGVSTNLSNIIIEVEGQHSYRSGYGRVKLELGLSSQLELIIKEVQQVADSVLCDVVVCEI